MRIKRLVLASRNPGKLAELRALLDGPAIEILPQAGLKVSEAEESGLSFIENAILKARHASLHTGLAALADDSGLAVDVLDGAPGIYSARYAGPGATDIGNNRKLLGALSGVPQAQRTARFHCVIVLLRHPADPMPWVFTGAWEGRILDAPRGTHGFGYDPLFYVPTHGCASAELDPVEKNRISHRAQALNKLRTALEISPSPLFQKGAQGEFSPS